MNERVLCQGCDGRGGSCAGCDGSGWRYKRGFDELVIARERPGMTGRDAVTLVAYLGAAALGVSMVWLFGEWLSALFGAVIAAALYRAVVMLLDAFMPANLGEDS